MQLEVRAAEKHLGGISISEQGQGRPSSPQTAEEKSAVPGSSEAARLPAGAASVASQQPASSSQPLV